MDRREDTIQGFSIRQIWDGMLMRGWQVMRDGKPISGLFDDRKNADVALIEFRNEPSPTKGFPHG
jgi:hypothetical protein